MVNLKKLWMNWCKKLSKRIQKILLLLVPVYKIVFSPHVGGACRFTPSCSSYAEEVLKNHSLKRALILIIKRLAACLPFGPFGWDPPPPKEPSPSLKKTGAFE